MLIFTVSLYLRWIDALAHQLPFWGRLRVVIPPERMAHLTPSEIKGLALIYEDSVSWNMPPMEPDPATGKMKVKAPHLGIAEKDFAPNDVRCALAIQAVEPWLKDVLKNCKADRRTNQPKLTPAQSIAVLEGILKEAARAADEAEVLLAERKAAQEEADRVKKQREETLRVATEAADDAAAKVEVRPGERVEAQPGMPPIVRVGEMQPLPVLDMTPPEDD
jgi:hypothetical protein